MKPRSSLEEILRKKLLQKIKSILLNFRFPRLFEKIFIQLQ